MKQFRYLLLLAIFFIPVHAYAQVQAADQSGLARLFSRLKSSESDSARILINDSIKVIIDNYAASDSAFDNKYRGIKNLGQILSSDSKVKIITWNMALEKSGAYFCYIIKRGVKASVSDVYKLEKNYDPRPISADTTYNGSEWYGALYYDIKPVKAEGVTYYILLGISLSDPAITRKVIDVLNFTPSNTILFGKKWFNTEEGVFYRHVFEYSSNGVMSLRFTASNSIVFDHLVPVPTMANEGRILYGSDYSFDAYIFRDGYWKFTRDIDARNRKSK